MAVLHMMRRDGLSIDEVETLFETAKLKATFDELDSDGSGTIAADELSSALRKLGYNVPAKQCEALLKKVDQDNDGQVSFDEFVAFFGELACTPNKTPTAPIHRRHHFKPLPHLRVRPARLARLDHEPPHGPDRARRR